MGTVSTRRLTPYDLYDRAGKGDKIDEKEYDLKIIPRVTQEAVKEFDIEIDKETIIPEDKGLIKNIFEAGLHLLVESGYYCMDTQRMIKVSEDEVRDGLKAAPRKLVFGEGRDSSWCEPVKVGQDSAPVLIQGGPTGAPVSEDVFVQMHQSYAQEAVVDTVVNGCLYTVEGHEATPNSPWELKAARTEQRYIKLATARANRPYMGI